MVVMGYLVMCLVFGTTFLAIKIGIDAGTPPGLSAGRRFFTAGFILYGYMLIRKKATLRFLFKKEMLITSIGLTFGTFATLYWAEQFVSSGTAAVLSATGPMMILLIQRLILKVNIHFLAFVGCIVGVAGVFLLILPSVNFQVETQWLWGCLLIVAGQGFYASGAVYSKMVSGRFEVISPITLNAAQMMHGGILLLLLSVFTEKASFEGAFSLAEIGSLVYLIVIGSMVGHSLFYWLMTKTDPVFPATWLFISPIIAVILGMVLYQESLTWVSGQGVLVIMLGTVMVQVPFLARRSGAVARKG